MKAFREHVAIAIDGGGIKGLIVARALEILEEHLGNSLHETFRLTAGTSTGSITVAGITAGLTGERMTGLWRNSDFWSRNTKTDVGISTSLRLCREVQS